MVATRRLNVGNPQERIQPINHYTQLPRTLTSSLSTHLIPSSHPSNSSHPIPPSHSTRRIPHPVPSHPFHPSNPIFPHRTPHATYPIESILSIPSYPPLSHTTRNTPHPIYPIHPTIPPLSHATRISPQSLQYSKNGLPIPIREISQPAKGPREGSAIGDMPRPDTCCFHVLR